MTQSAKGLYVPAQGERDALALVRSIQQLARGQTNASGSFRLTASATTTTVSNVLCAPNTIVRWTPTTANAAAQMATLYLASTDVTTGQFILHHASNTTTDQTFNYVLAS